MDVVAGKKLTAGADNFGIALEKHFVGSLYSSVDKAVGCELKRLHVEEGIVATCKRGCFYCCGQHILTSIAEVKALGHFIRHEFSAGQIEDLRMRTRKWHARDETEWEEIRTGRRSAVNNGGQITFSAHHYCPLLVAGECGVYPMRPLICRTHFVRSDPSACRHFSDPEAVGYSPESLATVLKVTDPFAAQIRDRIENSGLDYHRSVMLLPHWLAIEMNWDFAISPQFE